MNNEPLEPGKFHNRINRFLELVEMNAPPQLIAKEAVLIADAYYGNKQLLSEILDRIIEFKINEELDIRSSIENEQADE